METPTREEGMIPPKKKEEQEFGWPLVFGACVMMLCVTAVLLALILS